MRLAEDVLGLDTLLTPEQREWKQRARTAAAVIAATVDDDFERGVFRREHVAVLAEAGLLGMQLHGDGRAGADAVSYGLVCYELEAVDSGWRTLVSVQSSLAMTAIAVFGSEDQRERWLPAMARGEVIGCFALTEPAGGSDPASMATTARRDGDDWVLEGAKRWIGLATEADIAVVWARADDRVRGFIVPTSTRGFTATPITGKLSMRASVQCDVRLEGVRVPADAVLPEASGLSAPFRCLTEARFGIAWGAMGAARACLDAAVSRSAARELFGGPIGGKQLVQARLADSFVEYEKGMLLALHLASLKQAGALTPEQVSVGKLNNVREAIAIAHAARETLAGDGITAEFPVMRHLANLESVRTYEGTDDIHRLVIGRALTGTAAF